LEGLGLLLLLFVALVDLVEVLVDEGVVFLLSALAVAFFLEEGFVFLGLELADLADDRLESGEEAAVVVPQAG